MRRVGRSTSRRIYWWTLFGLFVLYAISFALLASTPLLGIVIAFVMLLLIWLFGGPWIACWLVPAFVGHVPCPGCKEDIDPVGVWHCGCGYRDHRERHLLAFRCPLCGSRPGHIDCPRCSATIILW